MVLQSDVRRTIGKHQRGTVGPIGRIRGAVNVRLVLGPRLALYHSCGKSTLLRIMAGLTSPSSAEVLCHNQRVTGLKGHGRAFPEALYTADRVVAFHTDPGRVSGECTVDVPGPRRLDSTDARDEGRRVADALEQERRQLFRARAGQLPQLQAAVDALAARESGRVPREDILETLRPRLSLKSAQWLLDTVIDCGRYAELFDYGAEAPYFMRP